ncbi:hypothetical protein ACJJIW_20820 [Microbulbifer sp. JMSA004]|uniref:hypothetical protein n=1 Tax=unclassified Microbulbifer TaxID=2619833 RepID=UPI0024AE308D|nr:hypothetical protein [Microbulbifer sp. VAAF005]WHI46426.1 hypothetical protein P0078_22395 [Microbulbifer sp. VAAF005]
MNKDRNAGPLITAQTGWEEAYLIGTEAELLEFAENIIQAVKSAKSEDFFGEPVRVSAFDGKVGQFSEVYFDWLVVTKDREQTIDLSRKVLGL